MKSFTKYEIKSLLIIFLILFGLVALNMSASLRKGRDATRKNDLLREISSWEYCQGLKRIIVNPFSISLGSSRFKSSVFPSPHFPEIAKTILFLASEDANYITGSVLIVDGGHD